MEEIIKAAWLAGFSSGVELELCRRESYPSSEEFLETKQAEWECFWNHIQEKLNEKSGK